MIILIDNYDSFTFNLYQYIGSINPDIKVFRNDKTSISEIEKLNPSHIVISPGPGFPDSAGISKKVIEAFSGSMPILGICLGHQAIGEVFGARITHSPTGPIHGKRSDIHIASGCPIFLGLPPIIKAGRYHSLSIDSDTVPDDLLIIAETNEGIIMGIAHKKHPVYGIQFHPESVLTDFGMRIIENFLNIKSHLKRT